MSPAGGGEPPRERDRWSSGFSAALLGAALLAIFVWFPIDIRGGFVEANPIGKPGPGDAFFPVLLAGAIALLAAFELGADLFGARARAFGQLTGSNLRFLGHFCATVALGLAMIYWLGPLVVGALNTLGLSSHTYRQLTDTVPYKYLGFVVGGFSMTVALIASAEGRLRPAAVVIAACSVALLVLIFDVLLLNIQLPPNADY